MSHVHLAREMMDKELQENALSAMSIKFDPYAIMDA
jgi:hypothetical protein